MKKITILTAVFNILQALYSIQLACMSRDDHIFPGLPASCFGLSLNEICLRSLASKGFAFMSK